MTTSFNLKYVRCHISADEFSEYYIRGVIMFKLILSLLLLCSFGPLSAQAIEQSSDHQFKAKENEKLYAAKRTKAAANPKSFETEVLIAESFARSVQDGNYTAALDTLDKTMDFDLSKVETPTEAMLHTDCGGSVHNTTGVLRIILLAIRQVEITQSSFDTSNAKKVLEAHLFAITCCKKIILAQESHLPANDERLVETLGLLGDECFLVKKYEEADEYYSRAYQITTHYHTESEFTVRECGHNFLANLRKVGRAEEADRLSKLGVDPNLVNTPFPAQFQVFNPEVLNHPLPRQF
jgi:hypothetical protein